MINQPEKRLALQAYERILHLIQADELPPGTLINERRMGDALQMSRTPVRDALLMLEGEGLLIRHGRALHVKQMRIDDYMDALQIRLLLEPAVARLAAGKLAANVLADLRARLQAIMDQAAEGPADRETVRGVDHDLHGMLCTAAGNPQLTQIITTLRRQTQMFDLRAIPERLTDSCQEHLDILQAIEAGDGARAAEAMTRHIGAVQDSIIARLTRR